MKTLDLVLVEEDFPEFFKFLKEKFPEEISVNEVGNFKRMMSADIVCGSLVVASVNEVYSVDGNSVVSKTAFFEYEHKKMILLAYVGDGKITRQDKHDVPFP